ncbi:MAG: TetR/AcrR family transcriptional regulator [Gammaproteobacteria bacterium]|nr:TetR/AcrR family transcriptional regulator [Gammaproteobacteria bacterium]
MIKALNQIDTTNADLESLPSREVSLASFACFTDSFPLRGEQLYRILFDRHANVVQTQKARFAIANIEKILTATFEISSVSGFNKMSLRDLSKRTGMSMGAIYSCISKKEDIAMMVADIVRLSSELTRRHAMKAASFWSQIEQSVRFHLYASALLQPWYFFLYFETRSLPEQQQNESKQIELGAIRNFEKLIDEGVKAGEFKPCNSAMISNTVVVLLEDWYLKPWKTRSYSRSQQSVVSREQEINSYHRMLIELLEELLNPSRCGEPVSN